jgi:alkylresorcinol/alkylpyrone synthase
MIQPAILGLGTAVPGHHYAQMELYETFMAEVLNNRRAPVIFRATEIDTRYSVLPDPRWLMPNPGAAERNELYLSEAPPLAARAIQTALANAGLNIDDIDDFIVVSCTGLDTPGLDILVAEKMAMSPTMRRTAIVGMGCHGLMPGLHRAVTAVQANPRTTVLVLTLELCTLHLQHDSSIRNVLGSALFGDGASAVIIGQSRNGAPRLLDSLTYSDYQTQQEMAFHPGNHGYRIHLSADIPKILRLKLPGLLDQFLQRNQLQLSDIEHWVVHPGGAKILDYVEEMLELPLEKLQYARSILREYGNMSSATLLFVLERLMQEAEPMSGDCGLLIGFGPGLTIELGLLQW